MDAEGEKVLMKRLADIHRRVEWMADQEAVSAWVNGLAAQGALMAQKESLLTEAENILDQLSPQATHA
jgi:hypothetical protein